MRPLKQWWSIGCLVWVPSFGYFIDVFDLVLFNVVRVDSLQALGLNQQQIFEIGLYLANCQRWGLLIGAFLWGTLADRYGRVKALSFSILLYSVATLLNVGVTNVTQYAILRFVAGVGLAGEMGAAIAWVSEILPIAQRSAGITIIALCGLLGGVFASSVPMLLGWRAMYFIGGIMGLLLLPMRGAMQESELFKAQPLNSVKGKFFMLLHPKRILRYLACIGLSMPISLVSGVLMVFSLEIGDALGVTSKVHPSGPLLYSFLGTCFGDLVCGYASQYFKNRKKVLLFFMLPLSMSIICFLTVYGISIFFFHGLCFIIGFFSGYWVLALAISAEQFGTNMRAMVTTTVPNLMRTAAIPLSLLLKYFAGSFGMLLSCVVLSLVCFTCAILGFITIKESFHKSLDFREN